MKVTMLVSSDGGRFVRVAHRPRGMMPARIAVQAGNAPTTDVSYVPVPGVRETLFAVTDNQLGDALLAAARDRPLVAEVDHGRAVVTLPGVKWRPKANPTGFTRSDSWNTDEMLYSGHVGQILAVNGQPVRR